MEYSSAIKINKIYFIDTVKKTNKFKIYAEWKKPDKTECILYNCICRKLTDIMRLDRKHARGCLGLGVSVGRLRIDDKGHKKTCGDDRYIYYPNLGDTVMGATHQTMQFK